MLATELYEDENDDDLRRETNEQFLARIMNRGCPTGLMIQMFVMSGLEQYCRMVAEADVSEFDNPMVNGAAWKRTGAWLQGELDKHYKD